MTHDNRNGFAAAVHDYYAHYVDNADAKAGALLVLAVAAGGALLGRLPHPCGALAASWIAIAFWSLTVLACLHALFPRLPGRSSGLIFWEDVHRFQDSSDYVAAVERLSDEEIGRAWATNAFHVAGVLHRKFWAVRVALVAAVLGFAAAAVSLPLR